MTLRSTRRTALGFGLAGAALTAVPAWAQTTRRIPQRMAARVIVDNDFAGDPDGLVALAHQLLAAKTRVTLVTSSLLDPRFSGGQFPQGGTATAGVAIAMELIRRLKLERPIPVAGGRDTLKPEPGRATSPAAQAIVAEAMRDDPLPLFFTCGGPLTNLAEALALEPRIAARMTVVWIGGGKYPAGGWEYNLAVDLDAARAVIEDSAMPLWQVPQSAYRQMQISIAELTAELRPMSGVGAWLYDRFTTPPDFVDVGGAWRWAIPRWYWPPHCRPRAVDTAISRHGGSTAIAPTVRNYPGEASACSRHSTFASPGQTSSPACAFMRAGRNRPARPQYSKVSLIVR